MNVQDIANEAVSYSFAHPIMAFAYAAFALFSAGQLFKSAALIPGAIGEAKARREAMRSAAIYNPDRGPAETAADRKRAGSTDSATQARRLRDHQPNHPTKPTGRH